MKKYLRTAAYFTNKFDMDRAATKHRHANWDKMNDTDRLVLDIIRQHSVKYGAAHLKYNTIAQLIDKSHSTVRRAIRKLVQLNIVEKTHFVRPVMNGLGANIYAIKPFEEEGKAKEKTSQEREETSKETVIFTCEKSLEDQTQSSEQIMGIVDSPLQTFYARIQAFLQTTIGSTKLARNIYGVFQKITIPLLKFSIHAHRQQEFEQVGIRALHIAVQATKKKNIRNLPAYFSGVFRNMMSGILQREIFIHLPPTKAVEFIYF